LTKRKLERFAELKTFPNVIEILYDDIKNSTFSLKGMWNVNVFKNNNPIVLELGCGKGEYTTGLAKKYPEKNFIGIDIKGARIWKGAKTAIDENLNNVFFIRSRIELINKIFGPSEINEIWITFPDPQPKKPRKRLTSSRFLNLYKNFLKPNALIHLKTDNYILYEYTLNLISSNKLKIIEYTSDLYNCDCHSEAKEIQTFYEKKFANEGISIKYLKFIINNEKAIIEPEK